MLLSLYVWATERPMEDLMARTRPLNQNEVDLLHVFVTPNRVEEIRNAIKEGKSVTIEESSFNDPTDYCKVFVEDICMAYLPGY